MIARLHIPLAHSIAARSFSQIDMDVVHMRGIRSRSKNGLEAIASCVPNPLAKRVRDSFLGQMEVSAIDELDHSEVECIPVSVLGNLGTGLVVTAATFVRPVICDSGKWGPKVGSSQAEIAPHPLCDRRGHGAAKRGSRRYDNESAVWHDDFFQSHDVAGPALTRPVETGLMHKSCNFRELQCAVRWP